MWGFGGKIMTGKPEVLEENPGPCPTSHNTNAT